MKRHPNPKRREAFNMYKEHLGNIANKDIAKELDVKENTINSWKYRDKWNDEIKELVDENNRPNCNIYNPRLDEQERIITALKTLGTYSSAFDVLISIYLDAYDEYLMAKEQGLKTQAIRKELARLIEQLGLDAKSIKKQPVKKTPKKSEEQPTNKLLQFRQRTGSK